MVLPQIQGLNRIQPRFAANLPLILAYRSSGLHNSLFMQ